MPRWSLYERMHRSGDNSLHKLLGDLEVKVMEHMWERAEATVRDIAETLRQEKPVAYTTVMTIMGHLVEKGLLTRSPIDKKTYLYHVALSKEEFLARSSQRMIDVLLADFGDLALAQFLEVVDQVDPQRVEELRRQLEELKRDSSGAEGRA